jgi:mRNA export factor
MPTATCWYRLRLTAPCPACGSGSAASLLLSTSWNKEACIWEVSSQGQAVPKARIASSAPLLSATFGQAADNSRVFVAGCSREVVQWQLATSSPSVIGSHSAPVKELCFSQDLNCVISGSWDKTLRYWDARAAGGAGAAPQASVALSDRLYAMDVKGPVLVAATADKKLTIFDLRKPTLPFRPAFDSPLKYQSRCVSIFPDQQGFAVGSIEGRVGIQHLLERDKERNFAFKCHRENNDVFSVNVIAFHQQFGTFATCGSDGTYVFWDKDSKQRLKLFNKMNNAVTAAAFSSAGNIFAYALGYDWSRGIEYYDRYRQPNAILLHAVKEDEIRKKPADVTKK